MKKTMSLKTFERYLRAADSWTICGNEDFITLIKDGKERKFPVSFFDEHIKSIREKYLVELN